MEFNLKQIFIAVEGLPGSGKTELARLLSEKLDARLILDDYLANPFLQDFYKDPDKFDLPLQLSFLVQRYNQQRDLVPGDLFNQNIVTNYIFDKDQIYANYNLDDRKYSLYNQILKALGRNLPRPDLVIYLHNPDHKQLFESVQDKKRIFEKNLTEEYMEDLNKVYNFFFERYNESPLLIVNVSNLDLSPESEHFTEIFNQIKNGIEGCCHLKL